MGPGRQGKASDKKKISSGSCLAQLVKGGAAETGLPGVTSRLKGSRSFQVQFDPVRPFSLHAGNKRAKQTRPDPKGCRAVSPPTSGTRFLQQATLSECAAGAACRGVALGSAASKFGSVKPCTDDICAQSRRFRDGPLALRLKSRGVLPIFENLERRLAGPDSA
jgi:hypothetical protein